MFCFNRVMSVVVQENKANQHMKNQPFVVGIIPAPNWHYKPVLYSHTQATRDFNKICEDIYIKENRNRVIDKKKTPSSVLYTLAAGALFGIYKLGKHLIKK